MLSPKQYRKLKSIQLFNGTEAKDYEENKDLYKFFLLKGLIKKEEVRGYKGFSITPDGETELYMYKLQQYHFWIPTFISFIALVVSIASFITKNEELLLSLKRLLLLLKSFLPS